MFEKAQAYNRNLVSETIRILFLCEQIEDPSVGPSTRFEMTLDRCPGFTPDFPTSEPDIISYPNQASLH